MMRLTGRKRAASWTMFLVAVVLLCGYRALDAQEETPENLVFNGNFELDADKDGVPDGWATAGNPKLKQVLSFGKGRAGGQCARLACAKLVEGVDTHVMLCQVGRVAVQKGKWYRLTFWAKQENIKTGCVTVGLRNTKPWSVLGLEAMFQMQDGADWKKFSFTFMSPADCPETSRLQLWHRATGTLLMDDVELIRVSGSGSRPGDLIPTEGRKNLVPNSSFECGTERWGSMFARRQSWGAGLDELIGEIDTTQAVHGKASMKIDLAPEAVPDFHFDYFEITRKKINDPLLGHIGFVRVKKGKPYTLSVYLKSRRPGLTARLGVVHFSGSVTTQTVKVSTSWKRYSARIKPRDNYCFVAVGPDLNVDGRESGTLWVDGLQLEAGKAPTAYEPSRGVEMGIGTDQPGNVFVHGKPVRMTASFHNATKKAQEISCDIRVMDFFDKEVKRMSFKRMVAPGTTLRETIRPGLNAAGFFRAHVAMTWANGKAARKMRLSIVRPYPHTDSKFGINHAYSRPYLLRLCKIGGITWARDWSLKWNDVEPEKSKWDFSRTDAEIDRILKEKLNVLGMLPFPSTEWSTTSPADLKVKIGKLGTRIRIAFAPRDKDEFQEYVGRTVRQRR